MEGADDRGRSCVRVVTHGRLPCVKTSIQVTPNDHTSVHSLNTWFLIAHGSVHRIGSIVFDDILVKQRRAR
jgi:hypothetical protein